VGMLGGNVELEWHGNGSYDNRAESALEPGGSCGDSPKDFIRLFAKF
jgi:hypothetical protein